MRNGKVHATAVILSGGGWPGAYDIVRTLALAGIRSFVASSQHDDIAFYSRFSTGKVVLPGFQPEHYTEILQILTGFGSADEKPILYYVGDSEAEFVSRFRKELQEYYRFLLPPENLMERISNKAVFHSLARENGLPVPDTRCFADVGQVRDVIDEIDFPCIVKPPFNRDWFWQRDEERARFGSYKTALRRLSSKAELLKFCEDLPENSSGFLIQPFIDGAENTLTSFHGYFDGLCQCLGFFLTREIRTNPPQTGESAYTETIFNDKLAMQSIAYLERLQFRGIVKIDYKWDARANEFKMLEIEPHFQFLNLLGAFAGMNLPLITYDHLQGRHIQAQHRYTSDIRILFFRHDIAAYMKGYRRSKEWSTGRYLKSHMLRKHYRVLDPRDPLPFLHSMSIFIKSITKKLMKRRRTLFRKYSKGRGLTKLTPREARG